MQPPSDVGHPFAGRGADAGGGFAGAGVGLPLAGELPVGAFVPVLSDAMLVVEGARCISGGAATAAMVGTASAEVVDAEVVDAGVVVVVSAGVVSTSASVCRAASSAPSTSRFPPVHAASADRAPIAHRSRRMPGRRSEETTVLTPRSSEPHNRTLRSWKKKRRSGA